MRSVICLGLAIEAIYVAAVLGPFSLLENGKRLTDLTDLTAPHPYLDVVVTLSLVGLFALYAAAIRAAARALNLVLPIVVAFTALFSVTLIFLYPVTAMDVYNYAVQGHVLAFDNVNPLVYPPVAASDDIFIAYAGSWATSPSPYGPVWLAASRWTALAAGWNVVAAILLLKSLAAAAVVATTALLTIRSRRVDRRSTGLAVLLFGWNPLVQLELVGNGHNDAVMIFLLVLAVLLLTVRRPLLAIIALAGSAFIKYLTLEALPYFVLTQCVCSEGKLRARLTSAAGSALTFGIATGLVFAPFWVGPVTIERARVADANYLSSISALIVLIRPSAFDWLIYPRIAVLATLCLWQGYRLLARRAGLADVLFDVSFVTILLANHFAGWYVPLLVALAALAGDPVRQTRAAILTFTTSLATPFWAYVWPAYQPNLDLLTFHLILVPLTFLPPLLAGVKWPWRTAERRWSERTTPGLEMPE
jgi:hypothetical protein